METLSILVDALVIIVDMALIVAIVRRWKK